MSSFDRRPGGPGPSGGPDRHPLPPRPEFTPADIRGNLAEALRLRCIGTGQPIKASWLCLETLDIYRHHHLPPDLNLVDALRVLTLTYTDAIKRGDTIYVRHAGESLEELGVLGGIPRAAAIHRRSQEEPGWDPLPDLKAWRVRVPGPAAWNPGAGHSDGNLIRTPHLQLLLVEFSGGAPVPEEDGCVRPEAVSGARILVDRPVLLQARHECLYLHGLVDMSEALRIERSVKGRLAPEQLQEELNYLLEAAWWFHLAALVAREVPADPAECYRRSRAKSSMLIRRIEAGKHFEMPALNLVDRLE